MRAEGTYFLYVSVVLGLEKSLQVKNAKNVIKNNFRILKKQYAYLQTILKAPVKFEKDWPKTVGGVAGRRMVGALTDGRMDRRTDGQTDGRTDRWTDGPMDGRTLKILEGIS